MKVFETIQLSEFKPIFFLLTSGKHAFLVMGEYLSCIYSHVQSPSALRLGGCAKYRVVLSKIIYCLHVLRINRYGYMHVNVCSMNTHLFVHIVHAYRCMYIVDACAHKYVHLCVVCAYIYVCVHIPAHVYI